MKLQVFGVFDQKVGAYGHPFFGVAIGQALRQFGDWVQDSNTPLHRHPEDYRLFHVGTFDDQTGELEAFRPVFLSEAVEFVEKPRPLEVAR